MKHDLPFEVPLGDDDFHADVSDDVWLTETAWYSFWTADAQIAVHVYLRFRHNIGIANSCVYAWRAGISVPWEAAYWKHLHVPIPSSLTDLELLGGVRHEQLDPYRSYRISYDDDSEFDGRFAFDVMFEAVESPQWLGSKHFDQGGVMRGELVIGGETHTIECLVMRDRSWYRRSDFTLFRSAYSYVFGTDGDGFLALFAAPREASLLRDDLPIVGGWWRAGGEPRIALTRGMRSVKDRDQRTGAPLTMDIEAVDSEGHAVHAHGTAQNSLVIAANANMLSWMSLVHWSLPTSSDVQVGEDQEIWSPSLWRSRAKIQREVS